MKKARLLGVSALSFMLAAGGANAQNFNDVPEEEIARAVVNVLKKDPKIVYDSLQEFKKEAAARKASEAPELSPLEEKLAAVMRDNPQLLVGALQAYELKQQQAELLEKAKTYQEHISEINRAEIFAGNPDGKYVLTEFFDFSCGYCKQMAPKIKNIIEKNPDLKVIFKPVSFLSPNSAVAAKAGVAAMKQGKFLEMYTRIMGEVRFDEKSVEKIARDIGLDMAQYKKDYASDETKNLLDNIRETANKIGMNSVPTLVLNGMPLYAVEESELQRAIDVLKNSK